MSEHRRKIPQPDHGGRAAARRNYGTASHGAGRRPAPTPRISPEATPATLVAARAAEKSHSRFKPYAGRTAMAGVLLAASGAVVLYEEPKAQSVPVAADSVPHAVYRTGGDGLYLHDGPGLETPLLGTMPDGMQFTVDCFTLDDPVNGNPVWLEGTASDGRHGSASDYYIDTHWNTTQDLVNQGIEQCGTQTPAAAAPEQQPTQPEQTPQGGGSVFYSPWDGKESPATYTMAYAGDKYPSWKSDIFCSPDRANNFPAVVDGKKITTLSGWSKSRLGPIYFLETAGDDQKDAINYILLIDPGNKEEYTHGCNERVDFASDPVSARNQSQTLADWLRRSPNNHLTILSGIVTRDEGSANGKFAHQGIQETLFAPAIRGHADITDQVLVCNYNQFEHQDIFKAFKDYMNKPAITSEGMCPRSSHSDGRFDGAWRP